LLCRNSANRAWGELATWTVPSENPSAMVATSVRDDVMAIDTAKLR